MRRKYMTTAGAVLVLALIAVGYAPGASFYGAKAKPMARLSRMIIVVANSSFAPVPIYA